MVPSIMFNNHCLSNKIFCEFFLITLIPSGSIFLWIKIISWQQTWLIYFFPYFHYFYCPCCHETHSLNAIDFNLIPFLRFIICIFKVLDAWYKSMKQILIWLEFNFEVIFRFLVINYGGCVSIIISHRTSSGNCRLNEEIEIKIKFLMDINFYPFHLFTFIHNIWFFNFMPMTSYATHGLFPLRK